MSLKPRSGIELIEKFLSEIDLVLIMSVEPGFGGQKFMPEVLDKVKKINIAPTPVATIIDIN